MLGVKQGGSSSTVSADSKSAPAHRLRSYTVLSVDEVYKLRAPFNCHLPMTKVCALQFLLHLSAFSSRRWSATSGNHIQINLSLRKRNTQRKIKKGQSKHGLNQRQQLSQLTCAYNVWIDTNNEPKKAVPRSQRSSRCVRG